MRVEEDLLDAAQREAEEREITFSALYRRALRRELNYPSLIAEVSELRRRVDKIEKMLAAAIEATDANIKNIHDFLKEEYRRSTR